jgi:hypothetical protein
MGQRMPDLVQLAKRHRDLLGRFAFELVIVFVGVTAAFALEDLRQEREEAEYRDRMVGALRASLDDWAVHGGQIDRQIGSMLREFDTAYGRGRQPDLPVYRERGGERPPTRAWDGIVATGAARALEPQLFFRLARFYSRADSFGDRYIRYNSFTEERVLPFASRPGSFYRADNRLRPEFAAYVERLRDLHREERALVAEAAELRDALPR